MNTFNSYQNIIEKLHRSISSWITLEECLDYFKEICNELDAKQNKNPDKDHWKKSRLRILIEVHERIELTEHMKTEMNNEKGVIMKRYMYPPLITYLRLTCFDQLGQPDSRHPFNSWLISTKKEEERMNIISEIEESDKILFSKKLYEGYNKIYGVKNSFFRFLREIISTDIREQLLNKIRITDNFDSIAKLVGEYIDGDLDYLQKEKYLYSVRNDFTHNTSFAKGYVADIHGDFNDGKEYKLREIIYKESKEYGVFISNDFEEYLKEVILNGIAEIIKKYKHSVQ